MDAVLSESYFYAENQVSNVIYRILSSKVLLLSESAMFHMSIKKTFYRMNKTVTLLKPVLVGTPASANSREGNTHIYTLQFTNL